MHYGLREEQLRRFIRNAKKGSAHNWVKKLMGLLECRLDNLCFPFGLCAQHPAPLANWSAMVM